MALAESKERKSPSSLQKVEHKAASDTAAQNLAEISRGLDDALNELGVNLEGFVAEAKERIGDTIPGGGKRDDNSDTTIKRHDAYVKWRNSLVTSEPDKKIMIKAISKTLHKKIEALTGQEAQLRSKVTVQASAYNDVIAQIRNVNGILDQASHASYTTLKALWLRIVHGIV